MSALEIAAVGGVGSSEAPERTPVSVAELQAAVSRAYTRVTGAAPTANMLRSLTAQASLETAGGRSMYNFNFGGIKGHGPAGRSASCLTHEVVSGETVTIRQSFRAYASLDEGAEDYIRVVMKTFKGALPSAASGDLDGFAHALKQAGYYTASEADYAAALKGASGTLSASPAMALGRPPCGPLPTSVDLARLVDALSMSALRIGDPNR